MTCFATPSFFVGLMPLITVYMSRKGSTCYMKVKVGYNKIHVKGRTSNICFTENVSHTGVGGFVNLVNLRWP